MNGVTGIPTVLLVEDDDDHYFLVRKALFSSPKEFELRRVTDGDKLMEYLSAPDSPRPSLILLDLNMPRKDGREVLREIKTLPELRHIPVVVLTTSFLESDVENCYRWGANSFIRKPIDFQDLSNMCANLKCYWLNTVELPHFSLETARDKKPH